MCNAGAWLPDPQALYGIDDLEAALDRIWLTDLKACDPPQQTALQAELQWKASCPAGPEPTLAMLFCSSSYAIEFDRVVPTLRTRFPSLRHIVGCTVSIWRLTIQPASDAAGAGWGFKFALAMHRVRLAPELLAGLSGS